MEIYTARCTQCQEITPDKCIECIQIDKDKSRELQRIVYTQAWFRQRPQEGLARWTKALDILETAGQSATLTDLQNTIDHELAWLAARKNVDLNGLNKLNRSATRMLLRARGEITELLQLKIETNSQLES